VVDALAEGHSVTVLCGRPSYDPSERHPYYLLRREQRGAVVVERVGSSTFPRFGCANALGITSRTSSLPFRAPCLYGLIWFWPLTDPPFEGIVGAIRGLVERKPFVYNIRDLYPEMAVAGSIVGPSWWVRLWERLHRWALRRASRVIVLGEDTRERHHCQRN